MTIPSRDGTVIAFDRTGEGPVLVLVGAALCDRRETQKLARLLSSDFTVVNYDRRGRGFSTDAAPYAVAREVDDVEALVDAGSGSAYLFGSSSGAVLALDAASRLGDRARGVFLYEPPFIVDDSRPPMPPGLADEIGAHVRAGRRHEAVKLFFSRGMGIPSPAVTLMRWLMPGWSKMAAMAHTIPYDLALLAGTQDGRGLPAGRWSGVVAPTLVMVGGKSEAFFHTGARALAGVLPRAEYRVLAGRSHGAVVMSPRDLAAAVRGFSREEGGGRAPLAPTH